MFSRLPDRIIGSTRKCIDCIEDMIMTSRNQIRCPKCRKAKRLQSSKESQPYYKGEKCIGH